MAEQLAHLIGGFEVERVGGEPEPLGIVQFLAGLNADQHILGGRVALSEIVGVVGRDDWEVEFPGEVDHRVVDGLVEFQPVVLNLQVEVGSEDLLELGALRPRPVDLPVHHQVGQWALGAGGQGDQPFAVLFQQLHVHPGLVVEPLEIPGGGELHQVPVARCVLREHDEMGRLGGPVGPVGAVAVSHRSSFLPAARRHVQLTADDRPQARVRHRLVELHGAEHVAMVRHSDGGHVEGFGGLGEIPDATGAVEEAVMGMVVQVYERGHGVRP